MKAKFLFFFVALVSLSFVACGDDDGVDCDESFNFAVELEAEADALIDATFEYSMDPSTENCEAFKEAYQSYLDAASQLQDCADEVGQGAEFQQALQDAQDGLDSLPC